jgi:ParB-like chromosome segregation protein Spo0J
MAKENPSSEEIHHLNLGDIHVNYDWNARCKSDVVSTTSDGVQDTTLRGEHQGLGTGIAGLMISLRGRGQETPVIVRKVTDGRSIVGKKIAEPYELLAGFRRVTAAIWLQKPEHMEWAMKQGQSVIPNTENGTILAFIRTVTTPLEARLVNAVENTHRSQLRAPDLVRVIKELGAGKGESMSQVAIAEALGIDQSYVSRLARIASLPQPVLDHWRDGKLLPGLQENVQYPQLTTKQLAELADMTRDQSPDEIIRRYVTILAPPPAAEHSSTTNGKDKHADRIHELGVLLGTFVRLGILLPGSLQWAKVVGPRKDGFLVDCGRVTQLEAMMYWDILQAAYDQGLLAPAAKVSTEEVAEA